MSVRGKVAGVFTHHWPEVAGHANFYSLTLKLRHGQFWWMDQDQAAETLSPQPSPALAAAICVFWVRWCNMVLRSHCGSHLNMLGKSLHGGWLFQGCQASGQWLLRFVLGPYPHIPRCWMWARSPSTSSAYSQHNWSPIFRYGCRFEIWASKKPTKNRPFGAAIWPIDWRF